MSFETGRSARMAGIGTEQRLQSMCPALPKEFVVPKKVRELIADLEAAGFENRGGKGSHRNFVHPNVARPVTVSGKAGDDAKKYQERAVTKAIEDSKS